MSKKKLTWVDAAKNRIYIRFEGFMTVEQALKLKQAYKDAIAKVAPGFTTLTYSADYVPGSPEVRQIVGEMTQMAAEAGLKKVARVVGKTPLGGAQINRLAKERASYPAKHFRTELEAENYLDSDDD